jgi:hypothetical protein
MNNTTVTPTVGMGVSMTPYTDVKPGTIIRIVSPKTFDVQMDEFHVVKGSQHDGSAEYSISPDPNGAIERFRLTKRGWRAKSLKLCGWERSAYYDPSF